MPRSIRHGLKSYSVCVLFQFNYEDHDKDNKITINIGAATRLFACAHGFKNIKTRITAFV